MKQPRPSRDWQPVPTFLLGVIVLVLAGLAALWWWTGTQSSLQWALQRAQQLQPIDVQEAQGSLRSGAAIKRLSWQRGGLQVEAEQVVLAWQPVLLFGGTLKFDRISAALVRITDQRPPSGPSTAPTDLSLPVQVDLDDLSVDRIEWVTTQVMSGDHLTGRYWYDGKAHWLRLDKLTWAGTAYRGKASLGAKGPLPLDAALSGELDAPVPGAGSVPVRFNATLAGPLESLAATAQVQAMPGGKPVTQASATARITPWAAQPIAQAQASFDKLDLASVWKAAPHTALTGKLAVTPAGAQNWQVSADIRNADAGPWDAGKLPVDAVQALGEWRSGAALVKSLEARLGAGRLQATGSWRPAVKATPKADTRTRVTADAKAGWLVQGSVADLNPSSLHSRLAALPMGGSFDVRQEGAGVAFNANLRGNGRAAPHRAKSLPPVAITLLRVRGSWAEGLLSVPEFEARMSDASASGSVNYRVDDRSGDARLSLQAPGVGAQADGAISETRGSGKLRVRATDLAQARTWLARLPFAQAATSWPAVAGRADLALAWQGGWRDPTVDATLTSQQLMLQPARDAADPVPASPVQAWSVSDLTASVKGRLSNAAVTVHAAARQGQRSATIDASGSGAVRVSGSAANWRATLASLSAQFKDKPSTRGAWRLALQAPLDIRGSGANFDAGAGSAALSAPAPASVAAPTAAASKAAPPATLIWQPVQRRAGELRTAGRLNGLPMSWVELLQPQLAGSALAGDMLLDGQWDASLGRTLRLDASLARRSGDLTVLADSGTGPAQRVPAGVREARLAIASRGEQLTATLKWDSERAGTADGRLVTRLAPGGALGWQWLADAPIDASLRAQLPKLGVWSLLAPPGWRLRGSLLADVRATGTRAQPQLAGTIAADDLALRSVVDGVELGGGRLRGTLEGTTIRINEFTLHGAGEHGAGGTLAASGDVAWVNGAPQLKASAQLTRLRASIRADRELTLSGSLEAVVDASATTIKGKLKVDQARITLPDDIAPRLGDDVVVRGSPEFAGTVKDRKADSAQARESSRPLSLAVELDMGDDFRVSGRGLRARIAGTLALTAQALSQPRLTGTLRTASGEYVAFGQRLDIERGVVRFTGVASNPDLDILALRPNLTQRVGVLITGTALAPFVRLYSEPDLPDAEKLAWLVTGRPAPADGAESALVQQAALALLTNRRPGSQTIASRIGLDQLSVRKDSSAGAIVTLGKRFADNFYASYERSLSGALGTLFVFYDVSKKLTVRGQAGERTAVDLIYTFRFD
ncbi:translocation/assembly module TamB domain-containing protein [Caenimonas koreensis]|uniref:translocation/assembly module TamB domain-containing protein n=1 Tax=Caenimonas koreensis TaxID=367474 RepID=UPI003784432E